MKINPPLSVSLLDLIINSGRFDAEQIADGGAQVIKKRRYEGKENEKQKGRSRSIISAELSTQ